MQVQDGLRNDLLPVASASNCRSSRCGSGEEGRGTEPALRQRAYRELGSQLGLDFADVSSALRAMVARTASVNGADAVPDVLKQIDAALEQTGKALRKAGFSDEQVGKALDGVRESLGASAAASAEITAAQSTTYLRKDKASLAIQTQEGDRVQIRFRSREGVVSQTATSASGEERRVYAFSSGRIEISVQGELNDDELAAIGDLVDKVESLAQDFFAGDVQKAFEAAANLGFDAEQIAGFALKLSTRESLRQEGYGPPPPPPPVPAPKPAVAAVPVPAAAADSTDATSATPASTDTAVVPSTAASEATPTTPAESTDTAAGGSVQNTLASYLRQVMQTLSSASGTGRLEFSMKWKLEVVVAAVNARTPEAAGTPATKLLGGSLQSLGEQSAAAATAAEPASTAKTAAAAA